VTDALGLLESLEEALFEELVAQAVERELFWSRHGGQMWLDGGNVDEVVINFRRLAKVALKVTGGDE
jgi:hypothetical protein